MAYFYSLLIGMAISLALAILIEATFIHFYEAATIKEDLIFVILINVVTNPIVVAIANSLNILTNLNKWTIQIPLEIIVVVIEWLFYKKYINNIKRPFRCAILANGISYLLPIVISFIWGVSFGLTTVFANPIVVSLDNFISEHYQQFQLYEQTYIANGSWGRLNIYKNPESPGVVATVSNGDSFYSDEIYESNGITWGNVRGAHNGWANLGGQYVEYANKEFLEDYKEKFGTYNGELSETVVKEKLVLWSCPLSSHYQEILTDSTKIKTIVKNINNGEQKYIYTDDKNREWVSYLNEWICISDPGNSALDITAAPNYILFDNEQVPPRPELSWIYIISMMGTAIIEMSIGIHLIKVKLHEKEIRNYSY